MIEGIGLGLRQAFGDALLKTKRRVDFLEVTPENWVTYGGQMRRLLDACAERWPIVTHSVSLSIGGPDPLDPAFLEAVDALVKRLDAPWWSDHICYSSVNGAQLHDLLPLPFSDEAVEHTAKRIGEVKRTRRRSTAHGERHLLRAHAWRDDGRGRVPARRARRAVTAGCYSTSTTSTSTAATTASTRARSSTPCPWSACSSCTSPGTPVMPEAIIDTHVGPIIDPVWELYRYTLKRAHRLIPTIIEWDQDIPARSMSVLDEVDRARAEAKAAGVAGVAGR